jgi:hypothetical protein
MKQKSLHLNQILTGFFILFIVLLSGCSSGPEKARKPSDDFSRGLLLADNASGSVAVNFEPAGDLTRVVVPYLDDDGQVSFRYIQIDEGGKIIFDQDIGGDFGSTARSPQILSDSDYLHFFWVSREIADQDWQLMYGRLDQVGEFVSGPQHISEGTERVDQYNIEEDGSGGVFVIWEDSRAEEVVFAHLLSSGEMISKPQVLIMGGENPSLVRDDKGVNHIAWMEGKYLHYSSFEDELSPPLRGESLTDIRVSSGNRLDGPVIGAAGDYIYIFWSILRQTGLEAGTAITEYLVFPDGHPAQANRSLLPIFPNSDDRFQPYQGDLDLSQIILPPQEEYLSTNFVLAPRAGSSLDDILVIGLAASQTIRLDDYIQIIIVVFDEGENMGYVMPTRTTKISKLPNVFIDQGGDLHLIWQDGSASNQVYYTSTAPEVKAALDRINLADLPTLLLSGGLEALTGLLLFPFAFPWMAVGLIILVIWRLVRNDEDVTLTVSKILVGLALLSYQASKLLFLPDIMVYVPFSAWIDVPSGIENFLKLAVPVVIFGLGMTVAELRRRKRTSPPSSLGYYVIVILVDALLTLSIYGVIFLGEY